MLGQSALTGSSSLSSDNRIFVYEVTGLKQTDLTDRNSYPIRNSGNVLVQVPLNRMNEEMRRITSMGGTIAAIRPLGASGGDAPAQSSEE